MEEKCTSIEEKQEKKMKVKELLYVFWLFDTIMKATDRQKCGRKDVNFKPSKSKDGKILIINVRENLKYHPKTYN